MPSRTSIEQGFRLACERYAELGVDCQAAIERLAQTPISLHCWQGDDVGGFENAEGLTGGGIQATGNYPGKARTADELRADAETGARPDPRQAPVQSARDLRGDGGQAGRAGRAAAGAFQRWVDWARSRGFGLDFNPTFFSHPKAADGFTLSHADDGIRRFWVDHGIACRQDRRVVWPRTGYAVRHERLDTGRLQGHAGRSEGAAGAAEQRRSTRSSPSRSMPRLQPGRGRGEAVWHRLGELRSGRTSSTWATRSGIGKLLCLDSGHYHPTENVADKISAVLAYLDEILLHVSRGVRWDSDHVVILTDELLAIAQEVVRGGYLSRVQIGLDFFDASINRVAAWVIGARAMLKALLDRAAGADRAAADAGSERRLHGPAGACWKS